MKQKLIGKMEWGAGAWMSAVLLAGLFSASAGAQEPAESASAHYRMAQVSSAVFTLPGVAAQVNGVNITTDKFWNRIVASAGNAILTGMVDEILIEQEAGKRLDLGNAKNKQKIESQVAKRFSDFRKQFKDDAAFQQQLKGAGVTAEDLKRQIRIDLYKEKLLDDQMKVSPEEVRKYFDDNQQKLASPEQVRLKHILVATEQEANDLLVSIKAGANFETLAQAKSLDKGTKASGGDLGLFAAGMLIPEIQDKAFALPVGGVDVAKTALGYHVIKVVEKKAAKPAVFDAQTKENIFRSLRLAKFSQVYPQWIQALRDKAQVRVTVNQ